MLCCRLIFRIESPLGDRINMTFAGTLTENQLTARLILFPAQEPWEVTGDSQEPTGAIVTPHGRPTEEEQKLLVQLCRTAVLANEGTLDHRDHGWVRQGDAVDIALLMMAHKADVVQAEIVSACPEVATVPFESERLCAASLNRLNGVQHAFVKGALERLLPMCRTMALPGGEIKLNRQLLEEQAERLAGRGYRIIALATGEIMLAEGDVFSEEHLTALTLAGLVGMIDPLRPEAKAAVAACAKAGIEVSMVTGDHPATAFAIAKELVLVDRPTQVITGP